MESVCFGLTLRCLLVMRAVRSDELVTKRLVNQAESWPANIKSLLGKFYE